MSPKVFVTVAVAVAVGLATAVSPFASSSPDGLNKVAEDQGFAGKGRVSPVQEGAPGAGYAFPGVADERLATGLAGFAGTLVVLALGYGLALMLRRRGADGRDRGAPWTDPP